MKKNQFAILTVEFPQVERRRVELAYWLREKAREIEKSKPEDYAKTVRFRFLKPSLSKK